MSPFRYALRRACLSRKVATNISRQLTSPASAVTPPSDCGTRPLAILWGVQCEGFYHHLGITLEPVTSWRQGVRRLKVRRRQTLKRLSSDLAQRTLRLREGSASVSNGIAVAQLVTRGPDDTIECVTGFSVECTPDVDLNVAFTPYVYPEPWSTSLGVTRFIMRKRIRRTRPFICVD
jgi:hypothetical protein